jgi:glycosylphosphatidylinositol transamidase
MLDRAAPHYPALDRGIDSLTVELRIPPKPGRETATSTTLIHPHYADTVRVTEHLVRSISNLHERLHHSVAQYTLPSISKFISHGEYIFPTILVSLPMVGRAVMLALIDIQRFRFMFVGVVIGFVSLITAVIYLWSSHHNIQDNTLVDWDTLCVYIVAHLMVLVVTRLTLRKEVAKWFKHSPKDDEMFTLDEHHKSLKFIACLAGIYLHVPLLLANYSLGLPSSVFWSLLLAIFMLLPSSMSKQPVLLRVGVSATKLILLVVTCPPLLLVPKVFGKYTMYIKVVYTALHLILSALWLSL